MKKFVNVALVCLGVLFGVTLYCYASETDALINKLVEKGYLTPSESQEIRNEINKTITKEKKEQTDEVKSMIDKAKPKVKLSGYTQMMYTTDPTLKGLEPFIIRRARIVFSCKLTDWASFRLVPDFANIAARKDGPVTFKGVFIDLRAIPEIARFRFGQDNQPFGFENRYSSAKKKVADTPYYMRHVLTTDYDYGIQWHGNLIGLYKNTFSWRVGVMNGTGMGSENNTRKDYACLLLFNPKKSVEIGVAGYNRDISKFTSTVHHYGGYVKIEFDTPFPLFFTTEYVGGKDSKIKNDVMNIIATIETNPLFKTDFLSKVLPVLRYELWDPNIRKEGDDVNHITVGINCYLDESVRILVDYVTKNETPSKKNNRLNFMLQVNYK